MYIAKRNRENYITVMFITLIGLPADFVILQRILNIFMKNATLSKNYEITLKQRSKS
jgi:hypothetical protein